eukprot:TRINITY_DN718_c0_g1_i1.p2 TRINITY_DN718_c0_g1~~TRINITY_DN718_c0_g1_i1.p2  ORF type:complete len:211 (-),score=10.34 TRINITY_DN718_c0_g1_i1:59-634(-)
MQNINERNSVQLFEETVVPLGMAFLTYTPVEECNQIVKSVNPIFDINPEKMVCLKNQRQDTCGGDSGGPVVIADNNYGIGTRGEPSKDILIGLTSWGPATTCDQLGMPGVYNNVGSYVDWITKVLEERSDFVQPSLIPTPVQVGSQSPILPVQDFQLATSPPLQNIISGEPKPVEIENCKLCSSLIPYFCI